MYLCICIYVCMYVYIYIYMYLFMCLSIYHVRNNLLPAQPSAPAKSSVSG